MSSKKGCMKCPNAGAGRSMPPPSPPSRQGIPCGDRCPSKSRIESPYASPQRPPMHQSFPRGAQQFQYDASRPQMQSPAYQPYPGQSSRPSSSQSPRSTTPQRFPTHGSRPTGAIRKVPGVAPRIPVRTPETPPIYRPQPRRQRPATAPVPAPAPPQPVSRPQMAQSVSYNMPRSPINTSLNAGRRNYDDSLAQYETLEDACKRDVLADLRAKRVQVLGVQGTSNAQRFENIPEVAHLSVYALDIGSAAPQGHSRASGHWSTIRNAVESQQTPAHRSPERAFPPADMMDHGFIEDEAMDFPESSGWMDQGFIGDDSMGIPPGLDMNQGFIEDESMHFPSSPGYSGEQSFPSCSDIMNQGFIEDESMEFPPSPGHGGEYSRGFPPSADMNQHFIEDESMEFPHSPAGSSMPGHPMTYGCTPGCTGLLNRRG